MTALADEAWARVRERDVSIRLRAGEVVEALPGVDAEAMERNVGAATATLARFENLDEPTLSEQDRATAAFVRDHLEQEAAEAERF